MACVAENIKTVSELIQELQKYDGGTLLTVAGAYGYSTDVALYYGALATRQEDGTDTIADYLVLTNDAGSYD